MPVANRPILFYGIEAIRDAGITDFGIVVGDTREEIKAAVGDGSKFGVKVTYIHQQDPLGLAHAVKVSRDYLQDDSFVMFLGDNLIRDGITRLVERFRTEKPNSQILLAKVKNPQEFGVAELEGERVVRLEEKPKQPRSDLALVGVYMFDKTIWEAVDGIKPSKRGELEITDAIQYLIDKKYDVRSHVITGWWKDTGKLEDMLEANRMILGGAATQIEGTISSDTRVEGSVIVGAGSVVEGSVLRGPLIIGAGCVIRRAYIGPFTSIADHCQVIDSEVEHSIILDGSRIEGLRRRLESSLIGKDVTVLRQPDRVPAAYRLMVGDHSNIEVM